VFLLVVGAVVGAFLFLRTTGSPLSSAAELKAVLENGEPTLVEFYTNT
jgi:hypothetical protein